jgi:large subunit ribosomal protein L3
VDVQARTSVFALFSRSFMVHSWWKNNRSIGKGFQGAMKRWGFRGLNASHGVSGTHRSHGSIGQHQVTCSHFNVSSDPSTYFILCYARQDPGRVFPGKKMAGHMGDRLRTQQNLVVVRIDTALNLVFVKGCVPGHKNTFVRVKDSIKKPMKEGMNGVKALPYPVATPEMAAEWPRQITLDKVRNRDPWIQPAA